MDGGTDAVSEDIPLLGFKPLHALYTTRVDVGCLGDLLMRSSDKRLVDNDDVLVSRASRVAGLAKRLADWEAFGTLGFDAALGAFVVHDEESKVRGFAGIIDC